MKLIVGIVNIILSCVFIYGIANRISATLYFLALYIAVEILLLIGLKKFDEKVFIRFLSPLHFLPGGAVFFVVSCQFVFLTESYCIMWVSLIVAMCITALIAKLDEKRTYGILKKIALCVVISVMINAQLDAINIVKDNKDVECLQVVVEKKYDNLYVFWPFIKGNYLTLKSADGRINLETFAVKADTFDVVEDGKNLNINLYKGYFGATFLDRREILSML